MTRGAEKKKGRTKRRGKGKGGETNSFVHISFQFSIILDSETFVYVTSKAIISLIKQNKSPPKAKLKCLGYISPEKLCSSGCHVLEHLKTNLV